MSATMDLSLTVPGTSLESYISGVNRIPVLEAGEERELAERLRGSNDLEAARKLVMSHLRFVVRVARGYSGYGLPQADLIQEGNIGLMKAVKRFDPAVGVRLVSFAVHWVRAEIHEFILKNWRIVKVATTKAQRKLFFNLRSSRKRLGWMNAEEVNGVAEDLGVSPRDVLEMEARMSAHDTSFDPPGAGDEETAHAPVSYLQDTRYDPAREVEQSQSEDHDTRRLQAALQGLDARSRDIVLRRWLGEDKATLQSLADEYGVSAERIRQIEAQSIKRLRALMRAPIEHPVSA